MTAIADFEELGRAQTPAAPLFAELDRICARHNGLWSQEAEDYLLANAPKIEIGEWFYLLSPTDLARRARSASVGLAPSPATESVCQPFGPSLNVKS